MKKLCFLLLLLSLFNKMHSQSYKVGEILVYEWQEQAKNHKIAYAIADVEGNFEDYYKAYTLNTKKLEDEHFSEKILIKGSKNDYEYQLIFKHWLIGQLFKFREIHKKYVNSIWWVSEKKIAYEAKERADVWSIHKYLEEDTKSSWVGNNLIYLKIDISFVDMGKKKTRIFYRLAINAKGNRTVEEVKKSTESGIKDIIDLLKD